MISTWLAIPLILTTLMSGVGGVVGVPLVRLALALVYLLGWRLGNGARRTHRSHETARPARTWDEAAKGGDR